MLRSKVNAPIYRELELVACSNCILKNLDTVGVAETHELCIHDRTETLDKFLVKHIVEECDILHTVVKCPLHAVLDELLGKLHVIEDVVERNLGLNHPELGKVTWSI